MVSVIPVDVNVRSRTDLMRVSFWEKIAKPEKSKPSLAE